MPLGDWYKQYLLNERFCAWMTYRELFSRRRTGATMPEALTESEHHALDLTRHLADAMAAIMTGGSEMRADWSEFTGHLHAIQHMIMSQAAARAYPARYRLLGEGSAGGSDASDRNGPNTLSKG